eukprot:jgi/Psemu1/306799/fgenesh1_kg.281_\
MLANEWMISPAALGPETRIERCATRRDTTTQVLFLYQHRIEAEDGTKASLRCGRRQRCTCRCSPKKRSTTLTHSLTHSTRSHII